MYQNAGTGVSLDPSVNPETLPPLGTSQAEAAHSQSRLQACVLQSFQFQFTSHIFARHLHQFHKESFYVRINEYFLGASIWIPSAGLHGLRRGRKIFRNEKSLSLSKSLIQLNFYEILRTNWKFWQIASFMAFMPVLL